MGVKKSTVCTRARCRSRRYTPASSKVCELTSTLRSNEMGSCGKTCRRACWPNFEAHPAHDESEVSFRICSRDIQFTSSQSIRHSVRWPRHSAAKAGSRRSSINYLSIAPRDPLTSHRSAQDDEREFAERIGIEPTSPLARRQRF